MAAGLSIITAIHNSLAMNRLYWKALSENTKTPFELILIDNHSTDGSEQFFAALQDTSPPEKRVVYVRNPTNRSYPASQNQGMLLAQYDILCFLNNDIWMPVGWHLPFEKRLEQNTLRVLSPSGQEAQPTQRASTQLKNEWKRATLLSKIWKLALLRSEEERLWNSLEIMYGELGRFESPTDNRVLEFSGIKGDSVVFHRDLLKRVPSIWDERFQAADWHLYLTIARLHEEDPTVPLPTVLTESYIHHFGRYSGRQKYEPIPDADKFLGIDEFWGKETVRKLWWGYSLPA